MDFFLGVGFALSSLWAVAAAIKNNGAWAIFFTVAASLFLMLAFVG